MNSFNLYTDDNTYLIRTKNNYLIAIAILLLRGDKLHLMYADEELQYIKKHRHGLKVSCKNINYKLGAKLHEYRHPFLTTLNLVLNSPCFNGCALEMFNYYYTPVLESGKFPGLPIIWFNIPVLIKENNIEVIGHDVAVSHFIIPNMKYMRIIVEDIYSFYSNKKNIDAFIDRTDAFLFSDGEYSYKSIYKIINKNWR